MEREALHAAAVKFSLDLHPSATGDVMEGVRDQLNTSLLRFVLHNVLRTWTDSLQPAKLPVDGQGSYIRPCCCRPSVYLDGVLVSYTNPCILSKQVTAITKVPHAA